ncbi:uncharacterized protein LOC134537581 isoform X4 [Bacillus rossius redtenbacheri]
MEPYSIVEFSDGQQILPSKWITPKKSHAYWPAFTSNKRYDTAVERLEPYEDSWKQFPLLRIMGTADTFEKGKRKLREAEVFSDINSEDDAETAKRRRREHAQRHNSSSSEDEYVTKETRLPVFPKAPIPKPKPLVRERNIPSSSTILNSGDHTSQTMVNELQSTPFQEMIIRMITDLKNKLGAVMVTQREILQKLEKLDSVKISLPETIESSGYEQILSDFPLTNEEQLLVVEEKLNSEDYKRCLVIELSKIGGGDLKSVVKNLLEIIFTNTLAEKFSYVGGKKKRVFSALLLCKIIQDITRNHIKDATNDNIAAIIKAWLRHAKERMMNEQVRIQRLQVAAAPALP